MPSMTDMATAIVSGLLGVSNTPFQPGTVTSLTAGTTSTRAQLQAGATSARVVNLSTSTIYLAFGDSTVTASASSMAIPAGAVETFGVGAATYVAVYAATAGNSVNVTSGVGS